MKLQLLFATTGVLWKGTRLENEYDERTNDTTRRQVEGEEIDKQSLQVEQVEAHEKHSEGHVSNVSRNEHSQAGSRKMERPIHYSQYNEDLIYPDAAIGIRELGA